MEELIKTSAPIASAVAIIGFALPSFIGTLKQKGLAKGAAILASLGALAIVIEGLAVKTGLLYGNFKYSDSVGYRLLDSTPWLIAFSVPPLILGAFWLANKITTSSWRVLITAASLVPIYVAIAPAVTRMSIWQFETEGMFYGVPLQAFIAWVIMGLFGGFILSKLWQDEEARRSLAYSLFALLWFWGGVNIGLQQYIPGAAGIVSGLVLVFFMWREKRAEQKPARKAK
jgi:uncharacterized membrane protein